MNNPESDAQILPATWKLLSLQIRLTINQFQHAPARQKFGQIVFLLFILGLSGFLFWFSQQTLVWMRSPWFLRISGSDQLLELTESLPSLLLSSLFVGTLLTSFGGLLQAMYLAGDMDFLLSFPIPMRAVFISKLVQAVLPNFILISIFCMPILFGVGAGNQYQWAYYLMIVPIMVSLAMAAGGLASLLVMLVVKVLPPRRAAEILGFAGAMVGMLCSQSGNMFNLYRKELAGLPKTDFGDVLIRANTPWMPLNWAGQGLVAIGKSDWGPGLLLLGITFGLALGAFALSLITAEKWYYSGWAGMQIVAARKKAPGAAPARPQSPNLLQKLLPQPVWAVVFKDLLMMRRDLRNLSQLVSPVILGLLYTVAFLRPSRQYSLPTDTNLFAVFIKQISIFGSLGISFFIGWILLSRLATMAFSQERSSYWILKASPLSPRHLILGKFLMAYLPAWGLSLIFSLGIGIIQRPGLFEFLYSLIALTLSLAGATGMLLWFGIAGANLTWTDPRQMNTGTSCMGQIISFLYLPVSLACYILPPGVAALTGQPIGIGYFVGILLGASLSLAAAILPPWLAVGMIERLGE